MGSRWRALYDGVAMNVAYLTRPGFRASVRGLIGPPESELLLDGPEVEAPASHHATHLPDGAAAYVGLHEFSLATSAISTTTVTRSVNVVLPEVDPDAVFAGVKTALEFGVLFAKSLALPLRVILLKPLRSGLNADDAARGLSSLLGEAVDVIPPGGLDEIQVGDADVWIATHWWTAHALDVACKLGVLDRRRIVYLIQDYEAGFYGWSTDAALARSTYSAGFLPVVNSTPLARYLLREEPHLAADIAVFGPSFDLVQLDRAFAERTSNEVVRFFFYARPSKPRNMYALGVAVMREAARRLDAAGIGYSMVMAGEEGPSVDLGSGTMINYGAMTRGDYFALLAQVDVGLSLQMSPHPSHPPFDLALAGAIAVTNDFAGDRAGRFEGIHAVPADIDSLAAELVTAAMARRSYRRRPTVPDLGDPMVVAVSAAVSALEGRSA
jgi:hypothetical protein